MTLRLGIIGFGNMGGAIGHGLVAAGALEAARVTVFDESAHALGGASESGMSAAGDAAAACAASDVVLVAVKPQDAGRTLEGVRSSLAGKAVVSIIAGWGTDQLQDALPDTRVLRVMPNTPALVGSGAYGLSEATTFDAPERETVEGWFNQIGLVEWVPEHLMDAVTGLSGGIPAYIAVIIEALADGGVQQGLKRPVAQRLATQSVMGTAQLLLQTGGTPGALKDAVCSPGGTTIEGVRALEAGGVRAAVMEAVIAASEKSARLG